MLISQRYSAVRCRLKVSSGKTEQEQGYEKADTLLIKVIRDKGRGYVPQGSQEPKDKGYTKPFPWAITIIIIKLLLALRPGS